MFLYVGTLNINSQLDNIHIRCTFEPLFSDHPFCIRNVALQEGWPLKRVKKDTFMFRFILLNDLSRGVGLSLGWPQNI